MNLRYPAKPLGTLLIALGAVLALLAPHSLHAQGTHPTAYTKYFAIISSEITLATFSPAPSPTPTPTPPSGVCPNCNGKGRLGDGTVSVECPVCDGTGKVTTSGSPLPPKPPGTSYADCPGGICPAPTVRRVNVQDSGGPHWSYPGNIRDHLIRSHGYTAPQLEGLSRGQMETLHDNAHGNTRSGPRFLSTFRLRRR